MCHSPAPHALDCSYFYKINRTAGFEHTQEPPAERDGTVTSSQALVLSTHRPRQRREDMEPDKRRRLDVGAPSAAGSGQRTASAGSPQPSPAATDVSLLEVDDTVDPDEDFQHDSRLPFDRESIYPGSSSTYRRPYDAETLTSTVSLYERDIPYVSENDRRYVTDHYYMPNDEDEQTRLQINHQVFLNLFDQKLTSVPLENPTRILDIGTGTGEWTIGMAETYPAADVIGTDLSPIQPTAVPDNAFFEVDDAENEIGWTYTPSSFDLIHLRNMRGAFSSWPRIYEQAFKFVKPGGWIEVIDFDDFSTFLEHFPPESKMHVFLESLDEAGRRLGRPRTSAHLHPEALTDFGFVDTKVSVHEIALGTWPDDPAARETGKLWLLAVIEGFEAAGLRLLTQVLGWDREEVRALCKQLVKETKVLALNPNRSRGLSVRVKVLVGRRPLMVGAEGMELS